MAWMVKYDKLDDDQKDFVDNQINKPGNIWIKGFAGSGKSVMLIHALRKKLQAQPSARACIIVYTHSLIDMFKTGMNEIGMESIPVMTHYAFEKENRNYDYIFCDEVQDLPANVLANMRSRSNHIFVAGDSNQSIYEDKVRPDQIGSIINARPFALTRIYRLTKSIMTAASNLLPTMDIFGSRRDMTKRDVSIRLGKAYDKEEEVKYIWQEANNATAAGYSSALLIPRHENIFEFVNSLLRLEGKSPWELQKNRWGKPDYGSLNRHFKNNGLKIEYVGNSYGSLESANRNRNLILMTYHSAKGLDFENVFLPFLSSSTAISRSKADTLLMVAITRSKMNLYITYSGYLHPLVKRFESNCQKINVNANSQTTSFDRDDFDF